MKFEKSLQRIAIYTAIPADLLAIIPALYWLWRKILVPEAQTPLPIEINIGFSFPIRDVTFVLIFYGFIAFNYWLTKKDQDMFVRNSSIGVSLLLVFPAILALTTFGMLSFADGLSMAVLCLITTLYFGKRFIFIESKEHFASILKFARTITIMKYRDIGILYFIWVPLIWLFLQIATRIDTWVNLQWAFLYTATGYILSRITVGTIGGVWALRKSTYSNIARMEIEPGPLSLLSLYVSAIAILIFLVLAISASWFIRSLLITISIAIVFLFILSKRR